MNLHQIKEEVLKDCTGDFKMVGALVVGENLGNTHIRFRKVDDYESFFNLIDDGNDSQGAIFNGCI